MRFWSLNEGVYERERKYINESRPKILLSIKYQLIFFERNFQNKRLSTASQTLLSQTPNKVQLLVKYSMACFKMKIGHKNVFILAKFVDIGFS